MEKAEQLTSNFIHFGIKYFILYKINDQYNGSLKSIKNYIEI